MGNRENDSKKPGYYKKLDEMHWWEPIRIEYADGRVRHGWFRGCNAVEFADEYRMYHPYYSVVDDHPLVSSGEVLLENQMKWEHDWKKLGGKVDGDG
jgi:hypothetical protein